MCVSRLILSTRSLTLLTLCLKALAIYEHLLTSIKEIRTLWLRPLNGASVILFFNRYILLVYIFDNMASVVSDIGIKVSLSNSVFVLPCSYAAVSLL